jgi:hypothetical protein
LNQKSTTSRKDTFRRGQLTSPVTIFLVSIPQSALWKTIRWSYISDYRKPIGEALMDRERYHRLMFLGAAIWNWLLAISFFALSRIDINYFLTFDLDIPNTMLWFDSFMGMVFVFGIGFYIVSKSMKENHGLILMACFEKFTVFAIPTIWFFLGQASVWVVLFVTVDLILGFIFI